MGDIMEIKNMYLKIDLVKDKDDNLIIHQIQFLS